MTLVKQTFLMGEQVPVWSIDCRGLSLSAVVVLGVVIPMSSVLVNGLLEGEVLE